MIIKPEQLEPYFGFHYPVDLEEEVGDEDIEEFRKTCAEAQTRFVNVYDCEGELVLCAALPVAGLILEILNKHWPERWVDGVPEYPKLINL